MESGRLQIAVSIVEGLSSRLEVVDVASGASHTVSDGVEDVFPFRASWISEVELLYTADGKIRRRGLSDAARDTAFTATVGLARPGYRMRRRDSDSTEMKPVRGIVTPAVSPDGEQIAFVALGDLWLLPIGPWQKLFPILGWTQRVVPLRQGRGFFDVE